MAMKVDCVVMDSESDLPYDFMNFVSPRQVCVKGDVVSSTNLRWCTSSMLDTSVMVYSGRLGPC